MLVTCWLPCGAGFFGYVSTQRAPGRRAKLGLAVKTPDTPSCFTFHYNMVSKGSLMVSNTHSLRIRFVTTLYWLIYVVYNCDCRASLRLVCFVGSQCRCTMGVYCKYSEKSEVSVFLLLDNYGMRWIGIRIVLFAGDVLRKLRPAAAGVAAT